MLSLQICTPLNLKLELVVMEMFKVTTLDLDNLPKTADGKIDYSKDFFGKPVSLTVSGQLNAECYALAFGSVYTFGPTFVLLVQQQILF